MDKKTACLSLLLLLFTSPTYPGDGDAYNFTLDARVLEGPAYTVTVHDERAYVGLKTGLLVLDITDPLNMQKLVHIHLPAQVEAIHVAGTLIFVANGEAGVFIIEEAVPGSFSVIATINTNGFASGLLSEGNMLVVADRWSGVLLFDITDPSNPVPTGSYLEGSDIVDVANSSNYVFAVNRSGD